MSQRGLGPVVGVLLLGLGMAALVGCSDQEAPRSNVVVSRIAENATETNSYGETFLSDVVSDEQSVFEDQVFVTFLNTPRSGHLSLEPDGPFGAVVLTDYRVDYSVPGESIEPMTGKMHLVVPTGTETNYRIVLVSAWAKINPPLVSLPSLGLELLGDATLTFSGYEVTSEEEIIVTAGVAIHFADWADEES